MPSPTVGEPRRSWLGPRQDGLDLEPIEMRHAVGLCPKRNAPRRTDRTVANVDQLLSIERNLEAVALGMQRQAVPVRRRDLDRRTAQLLAPAIPDPVEAHIVLQGVRTGDIVVIGIAEPDCDAGRP